MSLSKFGQSAGSMSWSRDTQVLAEGIVRRLRDVQDIQIPRLRECTAADELAEYEQELHSSLGSLASMVRQLYDDIEDADTSEERAALEETARTHEEQLERCVLMQLTRTRITSRSALRAAHRAVQTNREVVARDALRLGAQNAHSRVSKDDGTNTASEDVTHALQRTVALMSAELDKSGYSAQLLEESSATISTVSESYVSLNDMLRNSVSIIRSMERAELIDLIVLGASIAFFVGCVLYVLHVRVLSRGIWLLGTIWHVGSPVPAISAIKNAAHMYATPSVGNPQVNVGGSIAPEWGEPVEQPPKGRRTGKDGEAGKKTAENAGAQKAMESERIRAANVKAEAENASKQTVARALKQAETKQDPKEKLEAGRTVMGDEQKSGTKRHAEAQPTAKGQTAAGVTSRMAAKEGEEKKAADEVAAKKAEEEAAARKAAAEAATRKAATEAARKAEEEAVAKKAEEEMAARKAAEKSAAKKVAEEMAARKAAEAATRKQAEGAAKKAEDAATVNTEKATTENVAADLGGSDARTATPPAATSALRIPNQTHDEL